MMNSQHPILWSKGCWTFLVLFCALLSSPRAATNVQPRLTLSVNNRAIATVFRGWPALVKLEVLRSDSFAVTTNPAPFLIYPGPNGWNQTVRLTIHQEGGAAVAMLPELLLESDVPFVEIEWTGAAEFGWWLHPEQTTNLSAGRYELSGGLDTRDAVLGWKGQTNSPAATIEVIDEPTQMSPELVSEKFCRFAYHALWTGKTNLANSFVEELLAQQPTNSTALSMRGDLAAMRGDHTLALASRTAALENALAESAAGDDPPLTLISKLRSSITQTLTITPLSITARKDGADLVLGWNASPGLVYRLEASEDLQSWQSVREGLTTAGDRIETRFAIGPSKQFLRAAR